MDALAVVVERPESIGLRRLRLARPGPADVVVDIAYSGISTGTERLLWSGRMPAFPGMGYPLVPGYESVGQVVEAGPDSGLKSGDHVFVPGANCYGEVRGLFGGASSSIVTPGTRVRVIKGGTDREAVLLALAATARHAIAGSAADPDLIVGHGVLGRLMARMTVAMGATPTVWERDPARMGGAAGYEVVRPEDDPRRDYRTIIDASGNASLLDTLVQRLAPGGEIVLAGFYAERIGFAFPPAFMREARLRVAAEWKPRDMEAVAALVAEGFLSLDGLVTHTRLASEARDAYRTAFNDPACLKMILDWRACP